MVVLWHTLFIHYFVSVVAAFIQVLACILNSFDKVQNLSRNLVFL